MAKQTLITVTDDLDHREGAETVSFGFDGVNYEIDLVAENKEKLAEALAPFIDAGTRVRSTSNTRARSSRKANAADAEETAAIREWAKENGIQINARGRISEDVRNQYREAKSQAIAEAHAEEKPSKKDK